jgi:hypothetical protein
VARVALRSASKSGVRWEAYSPAERRAASLVCDLRFHEVANNDDSMCTLLEVFAGWLSTGRSVTLAPFGGQRLEQAAASLKHEYDRQPLKPFADGPSELSAAVIGALADEHIARQEEAVDIGLVATPWILALDMVTLAAFYWLREKVDIREDELREHLWGADCSPAAQSIRAAITQATWYDPCIGGGVFPVCIVLLLARLGVAPTVASVKQIIGGDLSDVNQCATRLRIALAVRSLARTSRARAINIAAVPPFRTGDSLEYFNEQLEAFANSCTKPIDIVVGNPPYVRAARLQRETRSILAQRYPSIAGGFVDLYQYFIGHGIQALAPDGVLCYVSPASFQRSVTALGTRRFIERTCSVESIVDFDELPVFDSASLHPSVYVLRRSATGKTTRTFEFHSLPERTPLHAALTLGLDHSVGIAGSRGWTLSSETASVIEHLDSVSRPLELALGSIQSGIKTGANDIYLLRREEAEAYLEDESSAPYIRPALRPSLIRRWRAEWDGSYMIVIPFGAKLPHGCLLWRRLLERRERLERRSDRRAGSVWYGLRPCAYLEQFSQAKMIFPDISTDCRFAIDDHGFVLPDGAFIVPRVDWFALGLLNSAIGRFYFAARCNRIGNPSKRGRLRLKKAYVKQFPVPTSATDSKRKRVEDIARLLVGDPAAESEYRSALDRAAFDAYRLPAKHSDAVLG